ncbi:MAG: LodA/GoxA family CTQ-dependent oxidase [Bacteroidetes bacterium]|nr:LodA/GoxA family CTQ-dependent oxidase [Bacteroidota bacterium]
MAITSIKIHPAIGFARLGNSPDSFFVGPQRPWERPNPPGGFKDSNCRVKRQAAEFRIFAYHGDGTVTEVTRAEADITWTVHVANKKAVTRNTGSASDLTIDPGVRTLAGPNQISKLDTGTIKFSGTSPVTVPLGELRTDNLSRLLVLGGAGKSASPTGAPITSFLDNAFWYDDVCDGSVNAHIKLRATGDVFDAVGAWVIVTPPKFSPQTDNVITLYDRIFQMDADQHWASGPATPSYTNDVWPILQRARTTMATVNVFGAHTWPDPVYDPQSARDEIFNRLANPAGGGGNMPELNSATLTPTQYQVMLNWKNNNFVRDWVAPPTPQATITAPGMDHAALENCVGAAFFPGIEAGGIVAQPIIDPTKYVGASDPMRLNQSAVKPGDIGAFMALPWQADFKACGSNWWPVPRPNSVIPEGTTSYQAWDRGVGSMQDMVTDWPILGFVVQQNGSFVEVERCDVTFITLVTPGLNFQDVPQGPMGMSRKSALAIAFEVKSAGAPVTLEVNPGDLPSNLRLRLDSASVTVGPTTGNEVATAWLWLIYETGPVGEHLTDSITVRHVASGRSWTIGITANTVARKVTAAALVLDRSGSMAEDRGDGQPKVQSLREAASIFVDVMVEGDGVGIVGYNQDALSLEGITPLGPAGDPFDAARQHAKDVINGTGLNPDGSTSIGDGIFEGRQILDAAGPGFDLKSMLVLTDGMENQPRWIADVAPQIDAQTYAIGLGTPQNTSAAALQTISGNNGGYLLLTGAISGDNRFLLQKYFLQILAGISNAEVVLDPDGVLVPGREQSIPFLVTEADSGIDVILLTEIPGAVDFRLQTPTGLILEPWRATAEPQMAWVQSHGVSYYRLVLPAELVPGRFDQAGVWHALLTIGRPRTTAPAPATQPGSIAVAPEGQGRIVRPRDTRSNVEGLATTTIDGSSTDRRLSAGQGRLAYSLVVHSYSNLTLRASCRQSGNEPGAGVTLHASLAESGMPARPGAHVWAEIAPPDGGITFNVTLGETGDGRFAGSFTATASGIYRCRIRASGLSAAGHPFLREQSLTAAVWHGGNRSVDPGTVPGGPSRHGDGDRDDRLCGLLHCLLSEKGLMSSKLQKQLREAGLDLDHLRTCIDAYCRRAKGTGGNEGECS